ncbi:MAG: hypothetical protein FJ318_10295 [SAR202 cluster bacterium]|nr:hypothetical protein [SAR202 cluster bacterium]
MESNSGLIRGIASWAVAVSGASRTVVLSAVNQAGRTATVQLAHILQHMDQLLSDHGMTRENVVSWACSCDMSVSDDEFYVDLVPAIGRYFQASAVKPAVTALA